MFLDSIVRVLGDAGAFQAAATFSRIRGVHDLLRPGGLFRLEDEGVALTFDDGPHPERTPRILDMLDEAGVLGTFFLIGKRARRHPEVVREIARRGHTIGNHSTNHPPLPFRARRQIDAEIGECQSILEDILGVSPTLLRPPFGARDVRVYDSARAHGLRLVMWSVDSYDWTGWDASRVDGFLERTAPGDIVLLHDGNPGVVGLEGALAKLLRRDLRFVALSA